LKTKRATTVDGEDVEASSAVESLTMRILLVGYGKMGRMVGQLAAEYGCEVAGFIDPRLPDGRDGPAADRWRGVDVAIDFSSPDAVVHNVPALVGRGVHVVVGTTGWQKDEAAIRKAVAESQAGVVVAPNFSAGVVLFEAVAARAAQLFGAQKEFGAWVHEAHHSTKKDAPSGTALLLKQAMEHAGFTRTIDMSSTRAGFIPGVHTIGFDGPAETITLTHTARDRTSFARGALTAAQWVNGRRGWFTMHDVLGLR
jgi:4-hydroxy-tetrahydrodipicolinate reductase